MWWVKLGNLILTKVYRAPRWHVSLSNKSNRPSIRAYLVNAQIYTWHVARLAQENNPEYILYINTQQIRDPWDLQKQSTFQCILITTQWSRLKNWTHKLTPCDLRRQRRQPFCLEAFLMSCLSLAVGGMGDDSLIIKERSHLVEKLNRIGTTDFLNHILWIYMRWLANRLVDDNEKGLNWLEPIPGKSQPLKRKTPPKIYFLDIKHMLARKVWALHKEQML